MKNESFNLLCSRIVETLEQNVIPWAIKIPRNAYTNKFYTGINALLLNSVIIQRQYNLINLWATHKQWFKLSFDVIKKPDNFQGDYGTKVVKVEQKLKAVDKGEVIQLQKYPNLESYTVFHFNQVNGDYDYYNEFKDSKKPVCGLKISKETEFKKYLREIHPASSELALTIASGFLNSELGTGRIEKISNDDLQKSKQNVRFLVDAASDAFKLIKMVYQKENLPSCFTDEDD